MTHEQKVKYFRIALNICQWGFNDQQVDLMVRLYELVQKREGATSVEDVVTIEYENKEAFKVIVNEKENSGA